MILGEGSYKTKVEFYNSLEKLGIEKLKKGHKEYELVVANARYRRTLLNNEHFKMKLAVAQFNHYHNVQTFQGVEAICAINLEREKWDQASVASDALMPRIAALHSGLSRKIKKSKDMVPCEEIQKAEIRCLQRQRLNTLKDTYDILHKKFLDSQIGKDIEALKEQKAKLEKEIFEIEKVIDRAKAENLQFSQDKDQQIKNMIIKILSTNQELLKREQIKSQELMSFEFAKPKSIREMFPQNLEEEYEKRSMIEVKKRTIPKIDPLKRENVLVSKLTKSLTFSNGNGSTTAMKTEATTITKVKDSLMTSYKEDTFVVNSNGQKYRSSKESSTELEVKPPQDCCDPELFGSNTTIRPTNFQKYDYLKSIEPSQLLTNRFFTPSQNQTSSANNDQIRSKTQPLSNNKSLQIQSVDSSSNPKLKTPKNSQEKVEILKVEVLKSADSDQIASPDRFNKFLCQAQSSGTSKASLKQNLPEMSQGNGSLNLSGSMHFEFPGEVTPNVRSNGNRDKRGPPNELKLDAMEHSQIGNKNKKHVSFSKKDEPQAGTSKFSKKPSSENFSLSPPESLKSFNFDVTEENVDDFAKAFNFGSGESGNFDLGFNFDDNQESGQNNSFKMDFTDEDEDFGFRFDSVKDGDDDDGDFFKF